MRTERHFTLATHVALEGRRGTQRMGRKTLACGRPDQHAAVVADAHRRRREQLAQCVRDQFRPTVVPESDETIRRPKVDTDNHVVAFGNSPKLPIFGRASGH